VAADINRRQLILRELMFTATDERS